MSNEIVRCVGIDKVYKKGGTEITPLQKLQLSIREGEFVAIMGPSGSGKTTLLNLLAGIDTPSSGQIFFRNEEISRLKRKQLSKFRAQHIGYIFQLYYLIPVLTAYENVELPLLIGSYSASERHKRVEVSLKMADIHDRASHYPRQLSGGQEQRVAIARALVTDPTLLVADEPTGDLDEDSAQHILQFLRRLANEHRKTIVMVTHDREAAKYADRTLHLRKGVLINEVVN